MSAKDEYEKIYDPDRDRYDPDEDYNDDDEEIMLTEDDCDPSYEEIYDEDGDSADVPCDYCGEIIKWKDGQYICPNCNTVISRSEFFNAIGADIPGEECLTCDNLYPGCVICPYGYTEEI